MYNINSIKSALQKFSNFGSDPGLDLALIEAMRSMVREFDNDANCDIQTNGEERFVRAIALASTAHDLVIDIGCNCGLYTLVLAQNNMKGRCLLIDANPACLNQASINLSKYPLRSDYICSAVGSKDGVANLVCSDSDPTSPINSLYDMRAIGNHYSHSFKTVIVHMQTLQSILDLHNLSESDILLLKADIEGSEYSMMQGAQELFKKNRIKYFQFEFGHASRASRTYLHDIVSFLTSYNYSLYVIKPAKLEPVQFDAFVENRYSMINFVAIAPGYQPV